MREIVWGWIVQSGFSPSVIIAFGSFGIGVVIEIFLKACGSFNAYVNFGENQVKSFFGLVAYRFSGPIAITCAAATYFGLGALFTHWGFM